MFVLVQKLKRLKHTFKVINKKSFPDLEVADRAAEIALLNCQKELNNDPLNIELRNNEKEAAKTYSNIHNANMSFLSQKCKAHWLLEGDLNTAFFHRSIRQRRVHNRVHEIKNQEGNLVTTPAAIENAFLGYYHDLLGTAMTDRIHVNSNLVQRGTVLSSEQRLDLTIPASEEEIKAALWSIKG